MKSENVVSYKKIRFKPRQQIMERGNTVEHKQNISTQNN